MKQILGFVVRIFDKWRRFMVDKQIESMEEVRTIVDSMNKGIEPLNLCIQLPSKGNEPLNQKKIEQEKILNKLYGMLSDGKISIDSFLEEMRKDNVDYE